MDHGLSNRMQNINSQGAMGSKNITTLQESFSADQTRNFGQVQPFEFKYDLPMLL